MTPYVLGAARSTGSMPCKICSAGTMHIAYRLPAYDLLECNACGFRAIPYLDGDVSISEGEAPAEVTIQKHLDFMISHLESSAERLAKQSSLLSQNASHGSKILDIGCGGGGFLVSLGDRYDSIGIELSPVWKEVSARRGIRVSGEPIQSRFWDAEVGNFDAITMWDVMEHVDRPKDVVSRICDLLKPGGKFILDTPSRDGLYYRLGDFTTRVTNGRYPTLLGVQYSPTPFDHKQIFRVVDMRRLLSEAGFTDLRIDLVDELSMPAEFYLRALLKSEAAARFLAPIARLGLKVLHPRNKLMVVATKA